MGYSEQERRRRSEQAKRLVAEGKFGGAAGRRKPDATEVRRRALLRVLRSPKSSHRQLLDASRQLAELDGEGHRTVREDWSGLSDEEQVGVLRRKAEERTRHWSEQVREVGRRTLEIIDRYVTKDAIESSEEFADLRAEMRREIAGSEARLPPGGRSSRAAR